ncbi:unnamed protein product [Soboliphyme baturini]|uniref:SAE2 domain-containing protein n=1 Tax=Soboliphyme baturini TaxID=241478 RepID=A0A183IS80_9BILA|nr:unnamed protein product [Soboliphyme baturini]
MLIKEAKNYGQQQKKLKQLKVDFFLKNFIDEYFDALPLASSQKNDRINMVSRHRAVYVRDKSPPNFWDVGFPSTPELYSRGMILVKR